MRVCVCVHVCEEKGVYENMCVYVCAHVGCENMCTHVCAVGMDIRDCMCVC